MKPFRIPLLLAGLFSMSSCGDFGAQGQVLPRDVAYENTVGIRITVENSEGDASNPTARLEAAVGRLATEFGPSAPGDPVKVEMTQGKQFALVVRRFAKQPETVHMLIATSATTAVCHLRAPPNPEVQAALPDALKLCWAEINKPVAAATPRPAAGGGLFGGRDGGVASASGGRFPDNWRNVDGVYFRSTSGVGVGGMVTISYEPLILFKDGTYWAIGDVALEDADLAAERSAKPAGWGRWSRRGGTFALTDSDGRTDDHPLAQGTFFKALPARADDTIAGRYEHLSGGGNSALGGEMTIAIQNEITFAGDGRFTTDSDVGALGSGATSGVGVSAGSSRRMTGMGQYRLEHHSLILRHPDGRTERKFFAFGSQDDPPRVDRDMLFIGDTVFLKDD